MTTTPSLVTPVRVLMVGKRQETMRIMTQSMIPQHMSVSFTDSVLTACRDFHGSAFDVVVLGRSLTDQQRTELRRSLLEQSPHLTVVKSFGPYGELVGPQVAQAAIATGCRGGAIRDSRASGRTITFTLIMPGKVTVTVLRHTFHLTRSKVYEKDLPAGRHSLKLTRRQKGFGRWLFASLAVNGTWQAVQDF